VKESFVRGPPCREVKDIGLTSERYNETLGNRKVVRVEEFGLRGSASVLLDSHGRLIVKC
jgi:hypothetical protein